MLFTCSQTKRTWRSLECKNENCKLAWKTQQEHARKQPPVPQRPGPAPSALSFPLSLTLTREVHALVVEAKPLSTVRIELDVPRARPPAASQPQAGCEPRATAARAVALHGAVLFMTRLINVLGQGKLGSASPNRQPKTRFFTPRDLRFFLDLEIFRLEVTSTANSGEVVFVLAFKDARTTFNGKQQEE